MPLGDRSRFLCHRCAGARLEPALAAAELPHVSLYEGTKHTFATDAIRRGVPERHLQRFLGHASVQSTRRYARLADNALIEVLRPLDGDERQASDTDSATETEQDQPVERVGPPGFEPGGKGKRKKGSR